MESYEVKENIRATVWEFQRLLSAEAAKKAAFTALSGVKGVTEALVEKR